EGTGPGGGTHERERRDLEGDRCGAWPFADHDVDPEILHRQVQHLLGRAGDPVDLVDEQDVPLHDVGEHRGEVAGPLQRGTRGDTQRTTEFGGDDHGQTRLPEPGRAGEQQVVRDDPALRGRGEDQPQLLSDGRLADEFVQVSGPERPLDVRIERARRGGHLGFLSAPGMAARALEALHQRFPSDRSASRSASAGSSSGADTRTTVAAFSASAGEHPRPSRASETSAAVEPAALAAGTSGAPGSVAGPTLSLSSRAIRSAVRLPTPGTRVRALTSPAPRARTSSGGSSVARIARASRGPMPETDCTVEKSSLASTESNPNSVSESSRTTNSGYSAPSVPRRSPARAAGVACTSTPTPDVSITQRSRPISTTVPRIEAITSELPSFVPWPGPPPWHVPDPLTSLGSAGSPPQPRGRRPPWPRSPRDPGRSGSRTRRPSPAWERARRDTPPTRARRRRPRGSGPSAAPGSA